MDEPRGRMELIRHLESQGILKSPRIIKAFRETPRHLFLREGVSCAYSDYPLPIGRDQTISATHMVAIMTELLEPEKSDRVMEIGSGSGWQAAILSRLVKMVYSIERDPELVKFARKNMERAGVGNVEVLLGDGWLGHPEKAPYHNIASLQPPTEVGGFLVWQ